MKTIKYGPLMSSKNSDIKICTGTVGGEKNLRFRKHKLKIIRKHYLFSRKLEY